MRSRKVYNRDTLLSFKLKKQELKIKIKEINFVKEAMNTILANNCYSEKEIEKQIELGQTVGNLNDDELKLLKLSWEFRKKKVKNCLMI
jgi:hypothetical protein